MDPKKFLLIKGQVETIRRELKNIRQFQRKLESDVENSVKRIEEVLKCGVSGSSLHLNSKSNDDDPKNFVDKDASSFLLKPIGVIRSAHANKNGTPRQSSLSSHIEATLVLDHGVLSNPKHSLDQLAQFSHVWLIAFFHANNQRGSHVPAKVKPPRLDGMKVGVFATRSPHRPNPLSLSLVKLKKVEGRTLTLNGVDLIDGTPVLDIKPYIPDYDSPFATPCEEVDSCESQAGSTDNTVRVAGWVQAPPRKELQVSFTPRAEEDLARFHPPCGQSCKYCMDHIAGSAEARQAICELLRVDPRSTYRKTKCQDKLYYFEVDALHVTCWFDEEDNAEVLRINSNKS